MTLSEAQNTIDEITEFLFESWIAKRFNVSKAHRIVPKIEDMAKIFASEDMIDMSLICLSLRDLLSQVKKDDIRIDASGEAYWIIPSDCELALITLGDNNAI